MLIAVLYAYLGDNCIQNFHLGRYIVRYTVRNLVLRGRASGAFNVISECISDNIPPQIIFFNMVIPNLMCFYSLVSNWSLASRIKPYKGIRHPLKCDVINDIKPFPTVYHRIYCRKFLMLSNQTSRNKSMCVRILSG